MAVNSATTLEIGNTAQLPPVSRLSATLTDYWALTKPEVNLLIVIATFASFYQASSIDLHPFPLQTLIHTLLGTLIVASGYGSSTPKCAGLPGVH